jgi:protein TonB
LKEIGTMLAYTASRRRSLERRSSPSAMLVVAVVHIAALAVVMSARMDLPDKVTRTITKIDFIPEPGPPPPPEPRPIEKPRPSQSIIDTPRPLTPVPPTNIPRIDTRPVPIPLPGEPIIGPALDPQPPRIEPQPQPRPAPIRIGPRFATPDHALKPPYPSSKLDSGEEAVLRLRLAIDERGRVTSVEPVGRADPAFLQAARRHLTARWRYQPATEDGRAIASSTVITLRFELE